MCCYGVQVRWSSIADNSIPDPPTAVLVHGILGSRKNWGRFFSLPIYIYIAIVNSIFPNMLKC